MNWYTKIDDTDWKIEMNGLTDTIFASLDKSFYRITMKTAGEKTIEIDGYDYTFYNAYEQILYEVTDLVRADTTGFTTDFISGAFSQSYSCLSIKGSKSTEFEHQLPLEISYDNSSVLPFWMQFNEIMTTIDTLTLLPKDYYPQGGLGTRSFNWKAETDVPLYLYTKATNIYTYLRPENCYTDKILFEWVSARGYLKSWWFTIDKYTYLTDKELNLQTIESGYYTLKNKRVNLTVKHKMADIITQKYLSDIVLSDEVYIYDGTTVADKLRVKIDNNSFDVSNKKRDILLTVNKFAYDTI